MIESKAFSTWTWNKNKFKNINLETKTSFWRAASDSSIAVEPSPHHLKVEGLSSTTASGTGQENGTKCFNKELLKCKTGATIT
jgi:hypothetical protein